LGSDKEDEVIGEISEAEETKRDEAALI